MKTHRWRIRWPIALPVIAVTLAALSLFASALLYTHAQSESTQRAKDNRSAQVQNCHVIGNPLIQAFVRKSEIDADKSRFDANRLREDVAESRAQEKAGVFREIAPGLSDEDLHALAEQQRSKDLTQAKRDAEDADELDKIADRMRNAPPCEKRYPPIKP